MPGANQAGVRAAVAGQFLAALFGRRPEGSVILLQVAPGREWYTDPVHPELPGERETEGCDVYYSPGLRAGDVRTPKHACAVWLDVDELPEGSDPAAHLRDLSTEVSHGVASGRGCHAYWVLKEPVDIDYALRLARLARIAYDGDKRTIHATRVLRLPGSFNYKYDPPREARWVVKRERTWAAESLEEHLVAAVLSRYWESADSRHYIAMAAAAVMARAGWDPDRGVRVTRVVCDQTADDERQDRERTVRGTMARRAAGQPVSSKDLRDVMGAEDYADFTRALGATVHDGELWYEGELLASQGTRERDIGLYVMGSGDWCYREGVLHRWEGRKWLPASDKALAGHVFEMLGQSKIIADGDEVDFNAKATLAGAVAKSVSGILEKSQAPEATKPILPLRNGVLDLQTLKVRPHSRDDGNRYFVDVDYDPEAQCPVWRQFLSEAVQPDVAAYLQEWAGYVFFRGNPAQVLLWLYGPSSTGKSTFVAGVSSLLGEATTAVSVDRLDSYSLAALAGSPLAICTEISARMLKTGVIKSLVSGDQVLARHPYGRPFPLRWTGKLFLSSNDLPQPDQGEGLWRRLRVVEFTKPPLRVDPHLGEKIAGELSGVLNWAVEGYRRVAAHLGNGAGWQPPRTVGSMVEEYRVSADIFAGFVEECLEVAEDAVTPAEMIYLRYQQYAKDHGYTPMGSGAGFVRELRRFGIKRPDAPMKVNGMLRRVYEGCRLAEQEI